MRRRLDRELAILLEVFEQRCVDQRVLTERYFDGQPSSARARLGAMAKDGDLVRVSRRRRNVGVTAWSVTAHGLARLQDVRLAPEEVRYETELPEGRVQHQLAMNHVGKLLGIKLTHEHMLRVPDAVRARSRVLPDSMFETTDGRRIYLEMDVGNYRADRFREKIDGMKDALGGWCELWVVTTDAERRTALLNEIGERKYVGWFVFDDVVKRNMPSEIHDARHPLPTPDEVIATTQEALKYGQKELMPA